MLAWDAALLDCMLEQCPGIAAKTYKALPCAEVSNNGRHTLENAANACDQGLL